VIAREPPAHLNTVAAFRLWRVH